MGAPENRNLTPPRHEVEPAEDSGGRSSSLMLGVSGGSLAFLALNYALLHGLSFFYIFWLLFIVLASPVCVGSGIIGLIGAIDSRKGLKKSLRIVLIVVHGLAILAPIALFLQVGRFTFD